MGNESIDIAQTGFTFLIYLNDLILFLDSDIVHHDHGVLHYHDISVNESRTAKFKFERLVILVSCFYLFMLYIKQTLTLRTEIHF